MFKFLSTISLALLFVFSCNVPTKSKSYRNGVVVTAHYLASDVGNQILKDGGNAFDAAVAVQFALAVAYPRAGNIAGGGFAVIRTSNGEYNSLDFRETAPQAAFEQMYLDENGDVNSEKSKKLLSLLDKIGFSIPNQSKPKEFHLTPISESGKYWLDTLYTTIASSERHINPCAQPIGT